MKKKVMTAAAVFSALLLVGCAGNDGTGDVGDNGRREEVRFATWDNEESLNRQQELVDQFNDSQEDITVKLESYGSDFDTTLTAGMGAGDAPDVMYMWNYPLYHEGLEPLDEYITGEGGEYEDNFYETTWNYNSINGVVYGLPVGFTTHALYYNKDMFDEAGVSYPDDTWTWDDLAVAAKDITNPDDNKYGFVLPVNPDPYDFEMYFWSNGSAYADEDGNTEDVLNSDESVEVLETFQKMLADGVAVGSDKSGSTEVETQTSAMMVSGAWEMNTFNEAGINYGIAPIPSFGNKDSVSVLSSSGLAMSVDSKVKDAAWEFIKFWTNEESNRTRIDYELPVLKNVVEEEGLEEGERGVFYTMLERSDEYESTSFVMDGWSSFSDDLSLVFESVFNPTTLIDPREALDNAVK